MIFPGSPAQRDAWILARRLPRQLLNPYEPYAWLTEEECGPAGQPESIATIFLTNRECPFRCTMCDLWRNTLTESVPARAIPQQIDFALRRTAATQTVKLYNSGSFFDPHAIPPEDYTAIAERLRGFSRIIVECHPALIGQRCLSFRDLLAGKLEVAMGLEIADDQILDKLNKRMTLDQFAGAANFLRENAIDLRVFLLVQPPFTAAGDALYWAQRSLDFAFACGASAVTLIPTRGGNGAMESLADAGAFEPPRLRTLEDAAAYGLGLQQGRVFADLWDLKENGECPQCFKARRQRLYAMNLDQYLVDPVQCTVCDNQTGEAI